MWMEPVSPLAIKLVAFGELALIKVSKCRSHPGMHERGLASSAGTVPTGWGRWQGTECNSIN